MPTARPSGFAMVGAGAVRLYSTEELLRLPPPRWLIDRVIPAGGLVGLYGPPGCGKSFVALDIALSVASGLPWQGQTVEPGFVVYISAEGVAGLGRRVLSWLQRQELSSLDVDVAWVMEALPVFSESEDLEALFGRFDELQKTPTLIVLDTLARCFAGDENQQQDMGAFVAGIDRMRIEHGATVVTVHHTNSSDGRERGSTAFRGAADTMIRVLPGVALAGVAKGALRPQKGSFTLTMDKSKESECFPTGIGRFIPNLDTESCTVSIDWQPAEQL
jgi:RecA-family ATPase